MTFRFSILVSLPTNAEENCGVMVGQITSTVLEYYLNIADMVNRSRGEDEYD